MFKSVKLLLESYVRPIFGHTRRRIKKLISSELPDAARAIDHESCQVSIEGIPYPVTVRRGTSDGRALTQCLVDGQYDIIPGFEPRRILDLGGNIGCSAIYFANRWPDSEILVVEPIRETFDVMRENVAFYPNIESLQAAAHCRNESLVFDMPDGEFWSAHISGAANDVEGEAFRVEGLRVDELLERKGWDEIDILKMDIEGSEADLFRHGPDSWLARVRILIIELHDGLRMGCSWHLEKALRRFKTRRARMGENLVVWFDGKSS